MLPSIMMPECQPFCEKRGITPRLPGYGVPGRGSSTIAAFRDRARLKADWAVVLQTNAYRRLIPPPATASVGRNCRKWIGPDRSGRCPPNRSTAMHARDSRPVSSDPPNATVPLYSPGPRRPRLDPKRAQLNVRFAPKATELPRRHEMARWAHKLTFKSFCGIDYSAVTPLALIGAVHFEMSSRRNRAR
jgi:hypothetical protein